MHIMHSCCHACVYQAYMYIMIRRDRVLRWATTIVVCHKVISTHAHAVTPTSVCNTIQETHNPLMLILLGGIYVLNNCVFIYMLYIIYISWFDWVLYIDFGLYTEQVNEGQKGNLLVERTSCLYIGRIHRFSACHSATWRYTALLPLKPDVLTAIKRTH